MNLLHEAEEQAISLIESHRDQIARLVARLEAAETLNLDAIRECLADDTKITPFVKSRR